MSIFDRIKSLFGGDPSDPASSPNAPSGGEADMMSCEEALAFVHEYLDGELEQVSEAQVKRHFDMCKKCYPHLRLESAFRVAMRRAGGGETAPAELRARVIELVGEAETEG